MNRMTDNQLEDTLMEEMKKIMSIEEMDGIEEEVEEYPTEQLEIRLHKYKNCHVNCIQVVLSDYLVETMVYEGTRDIGDQDRYALTPVMQMLMLDMNALIGNKWIEFIVVAEKTVSNPKGNGSIWLKTAHIYMAESNNFPMDMELVDQDYRYIVQFVVVQIDGVFHFKNLGIQTFV